MCHYRRKYLFLWKVWKDKIIYKWYLIQIFLIFSRFSPINDQSLSGGSNMKFIIDSKWDFAISCSLQKHFDAAVLMQNISKKLRFTLCFRYPVAFWSFELLVIESQICIKDPEQIPFGQFIFKVEHLSVAWFS